MILLKKWKRYIAEFIAILISGFVAIPLYLVVINSFKTKADAAEMSLSLPKVWNVLKNYEEVLKAAKIPQAFWNTSVVTVGSIIVLIILCSLTAFIIQRRNSATTRITEMLIITGIILPITVITTFYLMDSLGLVRTYMGVILLYVSGNFAFTTYLYISFIKGIPRELDEAAMIDGIGRVSLFFKIIFPLLKPATATAVIVAFMSIWNDFFTPFYFLNTASRYTLSVTIYFFMGQHSSDWNLVFANIVIVSFPVIILYLFMQRYIISGLTAGAVKS